MIEIWKTCHFIMPGGLAKKARKPWVQIHIAIEKLMFN